MQGQRSLKEIFKEYVEQGGASDLFDAALSHHIELVKSTAELTVTVQLARYVQSELIAEAERGLVDCYHFNSVKFLPRYTERELTPENVIGSGRCVHH